MFDFLKNKKIKEEFELKLPGVCQDGQFDCRYEVFRCLDKYYNGNTSTVSALRSKYPNVEVSDLNMAKMYSSRGLALDDLTETITALGSELEKADCLIKLMKENKAIIAEIPIRMDGKNYRHAVGIEVIKTFNNGKVVINVMNPSGQGGSRFTSFKDFVRVIAVTKFA